VKPCPATAARVDGPVPGTCRCTLPRAHAGPHLCEHGFRFTDAERTDRPKLPVRDARLREMAGVPVPGVRIVGEVRPHRKTET